MKSSNNMSILLKFSALVFLAIYGHSAEIFHPDVAQEEFQDRRGLVANLDRVDPHTDGEKRAIVDKHNEYRRQVDPQASKMLKMEWDDDLEHWAKLWASSCHWGHGWPHFPIYSAKYPSRAQNMWRGAASAKPVGTNCVEAWHNEKRFYDYEHNTCQPEKECGHYRVVVSWKTTAVGCARALCDQLFDQNGNPTGGGSVWIEVCNYAPGPPANEWKPYPEGTSCSQCSSKPGYVCDNNKLCRCNKNCNNGGTPSYNCNYCSCADGWYGDDCSSQECRNYDNRCWNQWSTRSYCDSNPETFEKCPAMCNRCIRGRSIKDKPRK